MLTAAGEFQQNVVLPVPRSPMAKSCGNTNSTAPTVGTESTGCRSRLELLLQRHLWATAPVSRTRVKIQEGNSQQTMELGQAEGHRWSG